MATTKKTRLTNTKRDRMIRWALENAQFAPALVKAEQDAYDKAEALLRTAIEKKYPAKDMAILKKYECCNVERYFFIQAQRESSDLTRFNFRCELKDAPKISSNYKSKTIYAGVAAGKAVLEHAKTASKLKDAKMAADKDFRSLAYTAKSFEEAVAGWPAWSALEKEICGANTALVAISPEVRKRVAGYKVPESVKENKAA